MNRTQALLLGFLIFSGTALVVILISAPDL
jgi:hypothetical protein